MTTRTRFAIAAVGVGSLALMSCGVRRANTRVPAPRIIAHSEWQASPPLGYAADATRRNIRAGDSLTFRDLRIGAVATSVDSTATPAVDVVRLRLTKGAATEEQAVREGAAFNWNGYHIAVVAIYGPGELGAGLVALEVGTLASIPPNVAASTVAGGADLRLRAGYGQAGSCRATGCR